MNCQRSQVSRIKNSLLNVNKRRPVAMRSRRNFVFKTFSASSVRDLEDEATTLVVSDSEHGDYYSILGLAPGATPQDIKRAYRELMKDWHPDQSNDAESNDFAIFLNQIYETLMDPDLRAEYDVISGFSINGTNPFIDSSYPAEFAFVDEFSCIGCRNCNNVCPKTFGMEEEYGRARVMQQKVDDPERIQEAIDTCPVSCIHWVSAPQLTLLEETMARMERVDAWILMNGGGKGANLNVFVEASLSWQKRFQALQARQDKARSRWAWSPFQPAAQAQAASDYSDEERSQDSSPGSRTRKRHYDAGSIAKAARKWRDYQRTRRQRKQRLLTDGESDING